MIARSPPPILAEPTVTDVGREPFSLEINLYDCVTRIASATPGRFSKWAGSIEPLLPVIPIAVRLCPGRAWPLKPRLSITCSTLSTSPGPASGLITISIIQTLVIEAYFCKLRSRGRDHILGGTSIPSVASADVSDLRVISAMTMSTARLTSSASTRILWLW